jgi:ABC-type transporter Mla subunit MlaD
MNNTNQPTPQSDDLAQVADDLSNQVDATAGELGQLGDNVGKAVEDGLAEAEATLDDFLNGLDNFLGKF